MVETGWRFLANLTSWGFDLQAGKVYDKMEAWRKQANEADLSAPCGHIRQMHMWSHPYKASTGH